VDHSYLEESLPEEGTFRRGVCCFSSGFFFFLGLLERLDAAGEWEPGLLSHSPKEEGGIKGWRGGSLLEGGRPTLTSGGLQS